jgi:hypothetical protein
MPSTTLGVVGTDGKVPVYEPNGRWCLWSITEIYRGLAAENTFVPKIKDYVIDPDTYTTYIVDDLDTVTLIPTLREIRPANMSFSFTETDVLFGVGPGTQSDTYRVYLDTSVLPHVLAVDERLRVGGSMTSYAKIFKGSSVGGTGEVISKTYDSAGQFVSESIGLELAAIDSHNNHTIKTVKVCHCTEQLLDGEVVTIVFYSDSGHVVSKRQLLVENTAFIRGVNRSLKYVTHISMDSPFMSPTLDKTIQYPLNIPINALNLVGTVHYSNGETLKLPVDGTKFRIFGLEQYTSTIIGQKMDLVLSYSLSPNETAYGAVGANNKMITEPYELITVNPNNSYTVKLFGYPFWVNSATGYQMRWWLFNLDRNVFFEVTNQVSFNQNTNAYDPKAYGYMQRKSVSLNLRDVSGAFKPFVHTQTVEIVLNGEPQTDATSWTMSHESNGSRPSYGRDLFAKKISATSINLGSALADLETWKTRVYKETFPLVNPNTEVGPLDPTHFAVTFNNVTTEYPISEWNTNLTVTGTVTVFSTALVRFIKRTASGDLMLSISALIVRP